MFTTTAETVRARTLSEYVGQEKLVSDLHIQINSAIDRKAPLDHIMLVAPPGYGKTTLAAIIADELGDPFLRLKPPFSEKTFFYQMVEFGRGIVFLDEIHNAKRPFQEMLLHALEEGSIGIDGDGYNVATSTFILGTTDPHKVIPALRSRAFFSPRFAEYSDDEMATIMSGMADRMGVVIPADYLPILARAAGGVPRTASKFVVACRDILEPESCEQILRYAGYDADGLSERQLEYLETLRMLGDQSGLRNICSMMQLSADQIEELERLPIRRKYIRLTPQGRMLTTAGITKVLRPAATTANYREIS